MLTAPISIALVAACVCAAPAAAHHSGVMFDQTKEIVLEGVVTQYKWQNPHTYLTIRTSGGASVEQVIEVGPPSTLRPLGLTADAVQVGDAITVRANPAKRGSIVLGRELVKADGTVLPLFLGPATRRPEPAEATASSIAGTWVPQGFFTFTFVDRSTWSFTEQGRAAFETYDPLKTTHAMCVPVTAPTLMLYPVASQIEVAADVVRLHVDWMTSERVVYLDGRSHPEGGERTLHGHSVGRWEGDVLVIDTTQFEDHRDGNAMGIPSGPRKHLIERLTLSDDRRHLRYDVVLEDPDWFAAPVTHSALWDYHPELAPSGIPCDLDVARRFLAGE